MTTQQVQQIEKITLNVKEVCVLLDVSTTTIYAMVRMNEIPHFKVRGKILFNRDIIEAWTRGEYQQEEVKMNGQYFF